MEQVFSYNADIEKTAYMNWRTCQTADCDMWFPQII